MIQQLASLLRHIDFAKLTVLASKNRLNLNAYKMSEIYNSVYNLDNMLLSAFICFFRHLWASQSSNQVSAVPLHWPKNVFVS